VVAGDVGPGADDGADPGGAEGGVQGTGRIEPGGEEVAGLGAAADQDPT
jgi:hypothetical protein